MRLFIPVLLVLAACQKKQAVAGSMAVSDQPMRFAWPDGAVGLRSAERYSIREVAGERRETRVRTSETWTLSRSGEGWLVGVDDARFDPIDGQPVEPALRALAAVPVGWWLDAQGRFDRMTDPDGWSRAARDAMYAELPEGDALAMVKVDLAVRPERVEALLERDWNALVGFWIGHSPVGGDLGTAAGFDPLGNPGDALSANLSSGGIVACEAPDGRCVRLVARSDGLPPAILAQPEKILEAWVDALPESPGETSIEDLDGGVEVDIHVDPATLMPYSFRSSTWISGVARADQETLPFRDDRGKTVTWAWTLPGGDG